MSFGSVDLIGSEGMNLYGKISEHSCNIGVIGLGHIGLTLASVLANEGFKVLGCDLIHGLVKEINSGRFKHSELEIADIVNNAVRSGKLWATTDSLNVARSCDIVIICVQTPLSKTYKPDLSFLRSACKTVGRALSKGKLIILESSIPPGTTLKTSKMLESMSGLSCGRDFWLSNCPERLSPGNSVRDFVNNDRIIGGLDSQSAQLAGHLFRQIVKGKLFLTDSVSSEIVKLAENTFRDVNIAFANELALICEQDGVDILEVTRLANTHPRVNIHMPGCGVGGPCLPKDPYLLLAEAKQPAKHSVIKCSRHINSFMESHTLSMVLTALRLAKKDVAGSQISILGVTYKKGTSDARYSPSKFIIQELMRLGAQVNVYDPLCSESFGGKKSTGLYEAIANTDCLVILTDHSDFASLDLYKVKEIMNKPACMVDGRRVISPAIANSAGIRYYGIGFGKETNTLVRKR